MMVPNCGTLQNIISRIIALHERNDSEDSVPYNLSKLSRPTAVTSFTMHSVIWRDLSTGPNFHFFMFALWFSLYPFRCIHCMVYKCHLLIHQSVVMRLFALCIMALALTIYLTLNLVVTTVLHGLDPSYLYKFILTCRCLWISIEINLFNIFRNYKSPPFDTIIRIHLISIDSLSYHIFVFCHLILVLWSKC